MRKALQGKVILVAGAGGIGSGLAQRYCAEGASVVIGDLSLESAREASTAAGAGAACRAVKMDGADEASVHTAVTLCTDEFGGLDGLHVNFATFSDGPGERGILELPVEIFDETQRINARGFYLTTRAALPAMLARGCGSIVYTSSIAAYCAGASQVAYAMSKAAGHALMRHVATRYGPAGIRANTIAPGFTLHARLEAELPPEYLEAGQQLGAVRSRLGRPADIASMGTLLLSDEGAYITGQVICIDGGVTMRA